MFNISSFLSKLSRNINAAELNKSGILDIVRKHTQLEIRLEDMEIKNAIVLIKASPAAKNKIFIFKNLIIEEINKTLPLRIADIR